MPSILLIELLILRATPEIIRWCWTIEEKKSYKMMYDAETNSINETRDDSAGSALLDDNETNNDSLRSSFQSFQSESQQSATGHSRSKTLRKDIAKQRSLNWEQKIR